MKKIMTALIASAALCLPSVASADPFDDSVFDDDLMTIAMTISGDDESFDTEEECEERLAEIRRASDPDPGRERGQFNKAFNQMFDCTDSDGDGEFEITSDSDPEDDDDDLMA